MKGKDPAFLFYSTDFYEGTRTMLPEERACFLDLMIYQHQRGYIPNDIKRVLLYCNGIDEATLKATLEAKFKLTYKGWINERLQMVIEEREAYSEKQSINGIVGQFWKKAKGILSKKDFDNLKDSLSNQSNNDIWELIKDKEINKATLEAMLEASLKHLEDRNRNRDIDKIIDYTPTEEINFKSNKFIKPSLFEVQQQISEKGYNVDAEAFIAYYESNGWKVGNNKMKDWKSALVTWQKRSLPVKTEKPKSNSGRLSLMEIQKVYEDLKQ